MHLSVLHLIIRPGCLSKPGNSGCFCTPPYSSGGCQMQSLIHPVHRRCILGWFLGFCSENMQKIRQIYKINVHKLYFWVREAHKFVTEINIVGQHHFGDNYTYLGCKYKDFVPSTEPCQKKKRRTRTILCHLLTASDQNCCRELLKHRFLDDVLEGLNLSAWSGAQVFVYNPSRCFWSGSF